MSVYCSTWNKSYLVVSSKKLAVGMNLWYIALAAAFVTRGSTGPDRCNIIRGTKAKGVNVPSNGYLREPRLRTHLANGNVALIPLTAQRLFYFSK